jgi:hypothetical protein
MELLILMAILSATIMPLLMLFMSGSQGTAKVTCASIAANLAGEMLEVLSSLPYEELAMNHEQYQVPSATELFGSRFTRNATVTEVIEGKLMRIDVKVTWNENSPATRDITFTTLVSNERI